MDTLQKIVDELAALVAEKLPPGTMEKDYLDQKIDALNLRVEALDNSFKILVGLAQSGKLPDLYTRCEEIENRINHVVDSVTEIKRTSNFDEMLKNRIEDSDVVRLALGNFVEDQIENNDDLVTSDAVREIVEDELGENRLREVVTEIIQNDIDFEVRVS